MDLRTRPNELLLPYSGTFSRAEQRDLLHTGDLERERDLLCGGVLERAANAKIKTEINTGISQAKLLVGVASLH